jgi:hypothetical protein
MAAEEAFDEVEATSMDTLTKTFMISIMIHTSERSS